MNNSTYRLTLDMHDSVVQKCFNIKRQDNAREIKITLSDNGKVYQIAEGCTATFRAKKPDGTVLFNHCAIENNIITYELTNQTSAVAGEVECELTLYDADEKQITSPRFALMVMDTLYSDSEIESTNEFTELVRAISETSNLNIDLERTQEDDGTIVTITRKDGTQKSETLRGEKGEKGDKGDKGDSIKGDKGDKGDAFTYEDFTPEQLASLKGEKGDKGDDGINGVGVPIGGTTGQILSKKSDTDFDTEWVDNEGGGGAGFIEVTYADYMAHREEYEASDNVYVITDKSAMFDANDVLYGNTTVKAELDNIGAEIAQIESDIEEINTDLPEKQNKITVTLGCGSDAQVASGNYYCSITIPKGTYLIFGYSHSSGAWLNGETNQNDYCYLLIQRDCSFAKIFTVTSEQVFSLVNLTGSIQQNYISNYIGAIKIA